MVRYTTTTILTLGILAHRTSEYDWVVQSLPKRIVGPKRIGPLRFHETILSFGEPASLGCNIPSDYHNPID